MFGSPQKPVYLESLDFSVESLEKRILLADLTGQITDIAPVPATTGENITIEWQVSNFDFDTIFIPIDVGFVLSNDDVLSLDDYALGLDTLPAGFPGIFTTPTQSSLWTLPDDGHAIWDGEESYYVMMFVDPFDNVIEWNEINNSHVVPLTVPQANVGDPPELEPVTDLADLPETGFARGEVFTAVADSLVTELRSTAKSQSEMARAIRRVATVSNSAKELRQMAASISRIRARLRSLADGRRDAVSVGQGETVTVEDLDLAERYFVYAFASDPPSGSQVASPSLALGGEDTGSTGNLLVGSAGGPGQSGIDLRDLIPFYDTYQDMKKWVDNTTKKIENAIDAVKNAPRKGLEWIAGLFGESAKSKGEAQLEAKAVTEGGDAFAERVDTLHEQLVPQTQDDTIALLETFITEAPGIFAIASRRLKNLKLETRDSVGEIQNQILDLEIWSRNREMVGTWQGTYNWESGGIVFTGVIALIVKENRNPNELKITLSNDFYHNGERVGKTRGTAIGTLDSDGFFRGHLDWRNGANRGSGDVIWQVEGDQIQGNIFEDPNPNLLVPFVAERIHTP